MNLPPKRRLPPHTTPENLRIRTNKVLKEKGVENHFQAILFSETAKFLMSLDDPRFEVYKPSVKQMQTQVWKTAFEFCLAYLTENGQEYTIETIQTEMASNQVNMLGLFSNDKKALQSYFKKLLKVSRENLPIPFSKRVKENKKFQEYALKIVEEEENAPIVMASAPNLSLPPMIERMYNSQSTKSHTTEGDKYSFRSKPSNASQHNPPLFIRDELPDDVESYDSEEEDYSDDSNDNNENDTNNNVNNNNNNEQNQSDQNKPYSYSYSYKSSSNKNDEDNEQNQSDHNDFIPQLETPDNSYEYIPKQAYSYQYTGSYETDD